MSDRLMSSRLMSTVQWAFIQWANVLASDKLHTKCNYAIIKDIALTTSKNHLRVKNWHYKLTILLGNNTLLAKRMLQKIQKSIIYSKKRECIASITNQTINCFIRPSATYIMVNE